MDVHRHTRGRHARRSSWLRSVCVSRRQDRPEELLPEEPDMRGTLSATMTLREFENGYWYRTQLKDFAERIVSLLRHSCGRTNSKRPWWCSCARAMLRCPRSA